MKLVKPTICLLFVAVLLLASCREPEVKPIEKPKLEQITLSPSEAELTVGETLKLTIEPQPTVGSTITYSSTNTEVATVTNEGVVTAVKRGVSIISADVNGSKGACEITVKAKQTLTITPSEKQLKVGETLQLQLTPTPANGAKIAFTSSDVQVASVSDKGLVTALKEGETTVTATVDGLKATSKITVVKAENPIKIELKSITPTNCIANVTATDKELYVFADIVRKDVYDNICNKFPDYYSGMLAFWNEWGQFEEMTFNGDKEIQVKGTAYFPLPDNFDVVIVAFGMDANMKLKTAIVEQNYKTKKAVQRMTLATEVVESIKGGAKIKVTPSDKNTTYYWDVQSKANYDKNVTPENEHVYCSRLVQNGYNYNYGTITKGDATINTTDLTTTAKGVPYYLVIFGYNDEEGIISPIYKTEFSAE